MRNNGVLAATTNCRERPLALYLRVAASSSEAEAESAPRQPPPVAGPAAAAAVVLAAAREQSDSEGGRTKLTCLLNARQLSLDSPPVALTKAVVSSARCRQPRAKMLQCRPRWRLQWQRRSLARCRRITLVALKAPSRYLAYPEPIQQN